MSLHNTRSPEGSAADDKPAGSRLQTSVPTEAIKRPVHIGIEPVTGEIENSLYSNNLPRALALTSWILRNEIPVTPAAFVLFGEIFAVAVPNYPCPVVTQVVIEHRHLLDELIDLAEAHHFDDLLLEAYYLLRDNAEVREKYQGSFKSIMVDEFQDTNPVQFEILRLLIREDNGHDPSGCGVCAGDSFVAPTHGFGHRSAGGRTSLVQR